MMDDEVYEMDDAGYENMSQCMVKNKRGFRNSSRSLNETNTEEAAAESGGTVIKLVFVSFGLLCIIQASLNVYLRLSLSPGEDHWEFFNGTFYHGSTLMMSWQKSREYCQERGADLIIINSREEQEFARTFKEERWIGLTDQDSEGVWKWVDGSGLTASFWRSGEPNDWNNEEHCVGINFHNEINNWNDISCKSGLFFICEKKTF